MDDFIADLESPRWWLSVVIAGILVNIAATYLTKLLDTRLAAASVWWRRRKATEQRDRLATVEALRAVPHKQALFVAYEVRCRLRSLQFLVNAIGVGLLLVLSVTVGAPKWLVMPVIVLFAVLWYVYVQQTRLADRASDVLDELHRDSS